MAKKSKTQRAIASARRAEKRELAEEVVESTEGMAEEAASTKKAAAKTPAKDAVLTKSSAPAKPAKEPGRIATFFSGVRSEMRRVTWPTRTDVIRWSGVVVGALLFFGVFVFILDNIFPQLLVLIDTLNSTGA